MNLSEHFTLEEFTRNSHNEPNEPTKEVISILEWLCTCFLEPIRAHFGRPIRITSGYRCPVLNALVGGKPTSYHQANAGRCAVDFQIPGVPIQEVFDWIRKESKLPVDQVILERGKYERHENDDCIHIQVRHDEPRKIALLGPTHNKGSYEPVEFIA
jgi:zinc D-Ala-D-Ala carboxypeptidase